MLKHVFLFLTIISILVITINLMINLETFRNNNVNPKEAIKLVENPLEVLNLDFYPKVTNYELKDWHDYKFMEYEATRKGLGENGTAVILTNLTDIEINQKLYKIEGLSAHISDLISVNRSIPDVRHELCQYNLYLKHLPPVTIIVIFHNECSSLIKRTLHSIFNRTPKELLNELVLVNDASTKIELYDELKDYINQNFPQKIQILNLKTRVGLIRARLEGAKKATSEILVFLDSHVEVNVNWLPPLIEPIALNPRTCTVPINDRLNALDFSYYVNAKFGYRGIVAWNFDYRVIYRNESSPTMPKSQPIMLGCAFAINRKFFWHLGGYDEELLIWNGENYELSFKLWLCGGELLETPCSRISHIFRNHNEFRKLENIDFVARNFKRIAEVWLDDYKKFLYKTDVERFSKINPGDLTKQKAIREKLNCRKFDYFLHYIAPEMAMNFALPRDKDLAYGTLSVTNGNLKFCLYDRGVERSRCRLILCNKKVNEFQRARFFHYTLDKGVEHDRTRMCFENKNFTQKSNDYKYKKNFWNFNFKTKQIKLENSTFCFGLNFQTRKLELSECDDKNLGQKWTFEFVN